MDVEREQLNQAVAAALTTNPGASTAEIAAAAGISRATLHRVFGSRDELAEAVYRWMLDRCDELFDRAGVDDAPVLDAIDKLVEDSYPLAQSFWLLIAKPELEKVPEIAEQVERQDERLDRLFARGQEEGLFRADLPPRWLAYSLGSNVMSAWYLVDEDRVGAREVPRLVRAATLEGALARSKD